MLIQGCDGERAVSKQAKQKDLAGTCIGKGKRSSGFASAKRWVEEFRQQKALKEELLEELRVLFVEEPWAFDDGSECFCRCSCEHISSHECRWHEEFLEEELVTDGRFKLVYNIVDVVVFTVFSWAFMMALPAFCGCVCLVSARRTRRL